MQQPVSVSFVPSEWKESSSLERCNWDCNSGL
jgi:hypothetical protein